MKAYILKTGKKIYPFMDIVSHSIISNKKLAEIQVRNIKRAGLNPDFVNCIEDIKDIEPHIVINDNLYISFEALKFIIKKAKGISEGFRCAIDNKYYIDSYLWHLKSIDGTVPLDIYYITKQGEIPEKIEVLSFECKKFDRERLPPHMEQNGKGFDQPLTNIEIIPIENWINLWQANISALIRTAYNLEFTRKYRQIIPIIRALGSIDKAPMYLNKVGKNCCIHPSAVIEASDIGDNVHIGANAVVRLCKVGNGAYVSDQALLRVCNIGENAYIANNNNVAFSVVYSGSFLISGPYQFSIFGKDCSVMHCIDCDCRLDGYSIKADIGGGTVIDTKQIYLGSCYGHRVRVGAGTISAPGSAVPNDLWINPNPGNVMKNFDSTLPTTKNLFLHKGNVVTKDGL